MGRQPQPRVFVGVDRALPGLAALRFAVAEARRRDVPLHAVRVQAEFTLQECEEIDAAFADAFGGLPTDVRIHREVLSGKVAEALTRRAHYSTDILVVGTDARGWWHALWYGSISRSCLRKAHCPVLVVPGPEMAQFSSRKHRWMPYRRDLWAGFECESPVARG
jgi:nucleotide-binding universal stress UspA family protein